MSGTSARDGERPDAYDGWIIIGRIRAPHGIRGEVRVELLTDFPERYRTLKRVYLGERHEARAVEAARFTPKGVLLKLAGVNARDAADALRGAYVALPEADLPPLPTGNFPHLQVRGLSVYAEDGRHLGAVAEILTTGSNDVYVVRGGPSGEILLPAIADVILSIDLQAERITVRLIPGLVPD